MWSSRVQLLQNKRDPEHTVKGTKGKKSLKSLYPTLKSKSPLGETDLSDWEEDRIKGTTNIGQICVLCTEKEVEEKISGLNRFTSVSMLSEPIFRGKNSLLFMEKDSNYGG
jgi:hypothetical protein